MSGTWNNLLEHAKQWKYQNDVKVSNALLRCDLKAEGCRPQTSEKTRQQELAGLSPRSKSGMRQKNLVSVNLAETNRVIWSKIKL